MAMTLARLRAIAKSEGVKGYSKMGKRELEIAIYQARCDSLDGTKEQSQATNKTTVEQAVAAVQSATTVEEIQAVLEQCKKDQLHEVFLAVTGIKDSPCPKSWKKADIVLHCKWGIVAYKARNAFKAMDAETRAEYLTSEQFELDNNSVDTLMAQLTPYELITLNAALGVTFEEYKDICEGYRAISSLKSSIRRAVRRAHMTEHERAIEDDARRVARAAYEDVTAKNATPVEETQEHLAVSEISSYVVGKQIAVLKGNAKAQQALLKDCGDEFLLAMHKVFSAPVRVTMEDPNELRKYMCRDVLKAIRTPDYARFLLASVRADLKKDLHVKRAYLEGWERFLSEYVPAMSREEKLEELRRQIRLICGDRYWIRVQLRDGIDKGRTAIYAQLTREGKELLRQYMELKHSQSKFAPVISPDYDSAFDEPAYIPDYQENLAALDDVPESRILDTQEVGVSYEDVRQAYMAYEYAMCEYSDSRDTDVAKKNEADTAYREYLRLLVEYRKGAMPKREMALRWVRKHFSDKWIPADELEVYPQDMLIEMSHACGIHAAKCQHISKLDMAVRLLRDAGIEPGLKTDYECAVNLRKEYQRELHEVWQQRRALRKALRLLGEDSKEARILEDMCCRDAGHPANSTRIERMLEQYRRVCRECADGRKYEAENKGISPAPVQEVKPIVELKAPELKVQVVLASKSKASHVDRKKSRTPIKKSHIPSWIQSRQLSSKASKHNPNIKPLVKLTKGASTVRVKKFY